MLRAAQSRCSKTNLPVNKHHTTSSLELTGCRSVPRRQACARAASVTCASSRVEVSAESKLIKTLKTALKSLKANRTCLPLHVYGRLLNSVPTAVEFDRPEEGTSANSAEAITTVSNPTASGQVERCRSLGSQTHQQEASGTQRSDRRRHVCQRSGGLRRLLSYLTL